MGGGVIVDITGDCPIIDTQFVEQTIRVFNVNSVDYLCNGQVKSYADKMCAQVFILETLKRSAAMSGDRLDHEHVTLHIRNHPEFFTIYI